MVGCKLIKKRKRKGIIEGEKEIPGSKGTALSRQIDGSYKKG